MDIVYILGNGSKWDDNELRYSLRSLEQHFKHDNVFIVGERPEWLTNIIHIDEQDAYPPTAGGKMKNAVRKIRAACQHERLSEEFVLMNDDFFFLRDAFDIPAYSLGTVQEAIDRHKTRTGYYYNVLRGTKNFLKRQGIEDPISYNVHYPIVYDKEKFLSITTDDRLKIPYSWRTIYGNLFNIGSVVRTDTKITKNELAEFLKKEDPGDFLSTTDGVVLLPEFQEWIAARFPEQSIYETPS